MPPGDQIFVTVVPKDGPPVTKHFDNPLALKIAGVTVLSYDPPRDRRSKGVLVIKVEGASQSESRILDHSSGEALVRLVDPQASVVLALTSPATGQRVTAHVARDSSGDPD